MIKPTVGELIQRYLDEIDPIKPFGGSHKYALKKLIHYPIGKIVAEKLKSSDVIDFCRQRKAEGVMSQTIQQDIMYMRSPLNYATLGWNLKKVSSKPIDDAKPILRRLQLICKSRSRDRRPLLEEWERLMIFFKEQENHPRNIIPMCDIMNFAVVSARRLGEICRLRWDDLNEEKKTCLVRNMKDPKNKIGNHHEFPLLGNAWNIIQAQPRTSDFIFPFNSRSITQKFIIGKKALGIKNLRFHDLRREAASRLFEKNFQVPEVMLVTGHKTPAILLRTYTKLKPEDLHKKWQQAAQ